MSMSNLQSSQNTSSSVKFKAGKKILVIGNGGRENTIVEALLRSPQDVEVFNFASSINPGIKKLIGVGNIIVGNYMDLEEIKKVGNEIKPDFAVVGPDDPIGIGAVDALKEIGIGSFAPTKKNAQLESSKAFTRNLLAKYDIEGSPDFLVSTEVEDTQSRKDFYDKFQGSIVVKADGLLGGKGVLVGGEHFDNFEIAEDFAIKSIEKFDRVVLEEKLIGEEFSLISLVDGVTVLDTPAIQDHKRAFDGDMGPNTGGMGCISDERNSLPFLDKKDLEDAHQITVEVMDAIERKNGERFVGVMYGGFMKTKNGIKLIEYNARFGDPEALNILPILETDFVNICEKAIAGKLFEVGKLAFKPVATVVKYLCPEGYPDDPVKDVVINQKSNDLEHVYFASVAEENGDLILKGSRAVGILGVGSTIDEARIDCEEKIKNFSGPLFYRKDIGTKELVQKRMDHIKKIL